MADLHINEGKCRILKLGRLKEEGPHRVKVEKGNFIIGCSYGNQGDLGAGVGDILNLTRKTSPAPPKGWKPRRVKRTVFKSLTKL